MEKSVAQNSETYLLLLQKLRSRLENPSLLTDSLVEVWKFVYREYPRIKEMLVPSYPTYERDFMGEIVERSPDTNWDIIRREDYEYIRMAEYGSRRHPEIDRVIIDLSAYDVREGIYWLEII